MWLTKSFTALLWMLLANSVCAAGGAVTTGGPGTKDAGCGSHRDHLEDALQRARANVPQLLAATTEVAIAHQDRVQARAAMLPAVSYTTSYLYTQGNGKPSGVFIANNAVHEYIAQGNAHEMLNLGPGQIASTVAADGGGAGASQGRCRGPRIGGDRGAELLRIASAFGYEPVDCGLLGTTWRPAFAVLKGANGNLLRLSGDHAFCGMELKLVLIGTVN